MHALKPYSNMCASSIKPLHARAPSGLLPTAGGVQQTVAVSSRTCLYTAAASSRRPPCNNTQPRHCHVGWCTLHSIHKHRFEVSQIRVTATEHTQAMPGTGTSSQVPQSSMHAPGFGWQPHMYTPPKEHVDMYQPNLCCHACEYLGGSM